MTSTTLIKRNLAYYWRTNLAVLAGVATAVAVLAGALLVGDSVRGSLRDLVLLRLGNTGSVVSSAGFFREKLADSFHPACPLIVLEALVTRESDGRRASGVQVYGVDERFWKFHGREVPVGPAVSKGLARKLGSQAGDSLLVRVEKHSDIPLESLHGRKEDTGRTIRLNVRKVLEAEDLGEFSLRPQQGAVLAVFLPLPLLQRDLKLEGKVNTILLGEEAQEILRDAFTLEDLGIKVRVLEKQRCLSLEKESTLIAGNLAEPARAAASALGLRTSSYFTYLVNSIRAGGHEIPYSLVTAASEEEQGLKLNDWAARDLGAKTGDMVSLEYYVWKEGGGLAAETAQFPLTGPLSGAAADRDLAPEFPGITESERLGDWDPPFPIDLKRVRPRDEEYWKQYRTTPKAFIPLKSGQQLWQSRFGNLTSIRIWPAPASDLSDLFEARDAFANRLRASIDPGRMGLSVYPVRNQGMQASRGATDFGEYFVYFSFFLVVSAVLLAGLFFKLGVEQRLTEIGVLRALGFPPARIRAIFLGEGVVLSVFGSLMGLGGALAYGRLIMMGLGTWWIGAVGTTLLTLHVTPASLVIGFLGGVLTSLIVVASVLRGLEPVTPRSLVAGSSSHPARLAEKSVLLLAVAAGLLGLALLAAAALHALDQTAGFFGAGALLLGAFLGFEWVWLSRSKMRVPSVSRLGFRNAGYRPGRSILCIALIASATFIVVAVDAFRRAGGQTAAGKKSGNGGFPLLAESLLPLYYDPNMQSGRESLNLPAIPDVSFVSFRLRPGDDASCLNLYEPRNPRILGVSSAFIKSGRFAFQESLGGAENPWTLLEAPPENGVGTLPAIADANSMTYVLHRKLGEEFVLNKEGGRPVRLRLVAALADSIFQGELLVSEHNFLRLFPEQQGFRFFLVDAPPARTEAVSRTLEESLPLYGLEVLSTEEKLAGFHRVENTYLSTFQTLGGLGLLLGTLGLAAVLLRNVLERRRELALLRAVGYRSGDLARMVVAENILLLGCGLVSGTITALLAIAPALFSRGGHAPILSLSLLLPAVLLTGLAASLLAVVAVVRSPLLPALRAE